MKFKNVLFFCICFSIIFSAAQSVTFSSSAMEYDEVSSNANKNYSNLSQTSNLVSSMSSSKPVQFFKNITEHVKLIFTYNDSNKSFDGFTTSEPEESSSENNDALDINSPLYSADVRILELFNQGEITFNEIDDLVNLGELRAEFAELVPCWSSLK